MSKEAGVHMSRSPLELELQAVVGTGIELMSLTRAICAEPSLQLQELHFHKC